MDGKTGGEQAREKSTATGGLSGFLRLVAAPAVWLFRYVRANPLTSVLFALLLGFVLYQRLPLYLEGRRMLGQPAPELKLRDLAGREVDLKQYRGRKVLLNFWATWCGPCRVEIPALNSIHKEMAGDKFELLAVTAEPAGYVRDFNKKKPMRYPVLIDDTGSVVNRYKIKVYPTFMFVNEQGRITDVSHGLDLLLKWKIRRRVTGSLF